MDDTLIAVTGATGHVGGGVARRLADAGARQRLVVRDPSRAPDLPGAEVGPAAEYRDGEAMRAALEGAGTLFLVSGGEAADRLDEHRSAVDAAVVAGVERIVYLSFHGAGPDGTFTFGRDHWHTEQHVRGTGVAFTFLRDNLYQDVLPYLAGADGVIRGPAGEGRLAAVARQDVVDVAAAVLLGDGHDGRSYDLTGPEALSLAEVAALLTDAVGAEVRYHAETEEEAWASRAGYGAPDWEVAGWVSTYTAIANGELEEVSGDVEAVTGQPPVAFADLLRRDREPIDWLRGQLGTAPR